MRHEKIKTTRRDADRPRVQCADCKFNIVGEHRCLVANKVFVRNGSTTCARFRPELRDSEMRFAPLRADVDLALQRLKAARLSWAVAELAVIDGRLAIRPARAADPATMKLVVACLAGRAGPSAHL